jgi:hypothetical protein
MAIQKVNLTRLAYVVYQHPDLQKFREFSEAFGLVEVSYESKEGVVLYVSHHPST